MTTKDQAQEYITSIVYENPSKEVGGDDVQNGILKLLEMMFDGSIGITLLQSAPSDLNNIQDGLYVYPQNMVYQFTSSDSGIKYQFRFGYDSAFGGTLLTRYEARGDWSSWTSITGKVIREISFTAGATNISIETTWTDGTSDRTEIPSVNNTNAGVLTSTQYTDIVNALDHVVSISDEMYNSHVVYGAYQTGNETSLVLNFPRINATDEIFGLPVVSDTRAGIVTSAQYEGLVSSIDVQNPSAEELIINVNYPNSTEEVSLPAVTSSTAGIVTTEQYNKWNAAAGTFSRFSKPVTGTPYTLLLPYGESNVVLGFSYSAGAQTSIAVSAQTSIDGVNIRHDIYNGSTIEAQYIESVIIDAENPITLTEPINQNTGGSEKHEITIALPDALFIVTLIPQRLAAGGGDWIVLGVSTYK